MSAARYGNWWISGVECEDGTRIGRGEWTFSAAGMFYIGSEKG